MNVLITGGSGFIGSNFIRIVAEERPLWNLTNMDSLTYASDPMFGRNERWESYKHVKVDICDVRRVREVFRLGKFDAVFHLAAESHVDRSISGPAPFVKTNVLGTQNLLEAARFYDVSTFVHVSTDEVYGSIQTGRFTEASPLQPSSPYSASKAGSDVLALSYFKTYDLPVILTRCSNNYGPRQHPEKFIPKMITRASTGKPLPVYGSGQNIRDWIHVHDHCRGLIAAFEKGQFGEIYNFGGGAERTNVAVAKRILEILGKPQSLIQYVDDRLGHDLRYAVDSSRAALDLGWYAQHRFDEGIVQTVEWYVENPEWVRRMS